MKLVDHLIVEMEQEAATTLRVLERVPGDKLDWRPHPKSRTLGQLAMHVAATPGGIAEVAHMDTFAFENSPPEADPKDTDEIIEAHKASIAKAKEQLELMDDAKAMGTWVGTMGGQTAFEAPRVALLRAIMLNHWYHHRGQLSVYLRELDVPVPSIYGPSADENPWT